MRSSSGPLGCSAQSRGGRGEDHGGPAAPHGPTALMALQLHTALQLHVVLQPLVAHGLVLCRMAQVVQLSRSGPGVLGSSTHGCFSIVGAPRVNQVGLCSCDGSQAVSDTLDLL